MKKAAPAAKKLAAAEAALLPRSLLPAATEAEEGCRCREEGSASARSRPPRPPLLQEAGEGKAAGRPRARPRLAKKCTGQVKPGKAAGSQVETALGRGSPPRRSCFLPRKRYHQAMSASLRIALAQLNLFVGDVAGNTQRLIDTSAQARDEHARRSGVVSRAEPRAVIRPRTCCFTAVCVGR